MNKNIPMTRIITDSELMETTQHGTSEYPFHFYDEHMAQFDFHCIEWHWHTEFEFVYIQSDFIIANAGAEQFHLTKGQGLFINSKVLHRFTSTVDAKVPNFLCLPTFIAPAESLIYRQFVAPILSSGVTCQVFTPQIPWHDQVLKIMQKIILLQNRSENELLSSALMQQMWYLIYDRMHELWSLQPEKPTASAQAKLQLIMSYMHEHYMEELSLDDIASHALLSKSTILTLFKNNLQMSPINYLIQYRLTQATKLLHNSEKKLASIAIETGFHNVEYFCRMFKKQYGITPTEYRKRKI